ncbi:hypothetical protein HNR33_002322 [Brassicibacter mesophilus]
MDLIGEVRDYINEPHTQYKLMKNLTHWHQVCSSLDVLEDTTWGIEFYNNSDYPAEVGGKYLYTYGLLQLLFVQQDAIKHLSEIFNIEVNLKRDYPELYEIREIRNDTIGHPTKRGHKDPSYIYISQITLNKRGFQYLSKIINEEMEFKDVNIIDLVKKQKNQVSNILNEIINKLNNENKSHKSKFKNKALMDMIDGSIYYDFAKLYDNDTFIQVNLDCIKDVFSEIKEGIAERYFSIEALDSVFHLYKDIDYLINKLEGLLNTYEELSDMEYKLTIESLEQKYEKLVKICEEIDEEFAMEE